MLKRGLTSVDRISVVALASCLSRPETVCWYSRPSSVNCTARCERVNNLTSRYCSRFRIFWLIAACVKCSSSPARVKDNKRAADSKATSGPRSTSGSSRPAHRCSRGAIRGGYSASGWHVSTRRTFAESEAIPNKNEGVWPLLYQAVKSGNHSIKLGMVAFGAGWDMASFRQIHGLGAAFTA